MDRMKAFGVCVGQCENCRRLLYETSRRYWVRIGSDAYLFCEHCVIVIEKKNLKAGKDDD